MVDFEERMDRDSCMFTFLITSITIYCLLKSSSPTLD